MMDRDLQKHAREFKGYLDKHQYEVGPEGILFPQAHAVASGEYFFDTNCGERPGVAPNLIPTQGLNYLLEAALRGGAAFTQFYLAPFSGAYTPVDGVTAQTFATAATEITSATEGYTETTRRPWTQAAAAGGIMDNVASRASFTIATATELTIRGAALLSDPVKGGTNGVLISISRFAADRKESAGNVFNLGYRVRLRPPQA